MTPQEVRQSFVDFFVAKGHKHVPSASLIPDAVSTTLFTIAGMEPFVPVFLGSQTPPAPRVVSVQRCMRVAGGKNDLNNVGRTGYHATFLEMLGNFSFGDYYKREAIAWAWQYLTRILELAPERLFATVYIDDDEAADIWQRDIGLTPDRISRFREDNFWDMGPTGPCGPSSEVFYDVGAAAGCAKSSCGVGCPDCNRYLEIWNLVFQQYDRDAGGMLHLLPKKCIDTGMGFERLCMVLAGKTSIFETDLYAHIIAALPGSDNSPLSFEESAVHKRIIADHSRAVTFLIADGVSPSNTERGYVLRFLIRRAIRSGKVLGYASDFFAKLIPTVVATLADGYPELPTEQERVISVLRGEERQFDRTLSRGEARLQALLQELRANREVELSGASIFELHDTYGFPPELTSEIAAEHGLSVDMPAYGQAMEAQRQRARSDAEAKRVQLQAASSTASDTHASEFVGYDTTAARARVVALFNNAGARLTALEAGQQGLAILDRTPFYAERGGQIGDRGVFALDGTSFEVTNTYYQDKTYRCIVHAGNVRSGALVVGDAVEAIVDPWWRREIRRHHTVTHLLQRALKDVAGESVNQRGSAVFPDRTRFDFDSPVGALSKEQRNQAAARVNELIRADYHRAVEVMRFPEAIKRGAIYIKGEHYGEIVRVVQFGPSVELCGGTHVESSGEIGHFVLLSEGAVGAGIRRVEGVVSESADAYVSRIRAAVEEAGSALTASVDQLPDAAVRLARERRDLERRIAGLQAQLAQSKADQVIRDKKDIDGVSYLIARADNPGTSMRDLAESIRARLPSGVIVVAAQDEGRASLLVTASADVIARGVSAKAIVEAMAKHIDGKGGGDAALAQGGGKHAEGLNAAFATVSSTIHEAVNG